MPKRQYGLKVDVWSYDYTGAFYLTGGVTGGATPAGVFRDAPKPLIKQIIEGDGGVTQALLDILGDAENVSKTEYKRRPTENRFELHLDTYYLTAEFSWNGGSVEYDMNSTEGLSTIARRLEEGEQVRPNAFKEGTPPEDQEDLTDF